VCRQHVQQLVTDDVFNELYTANCIPGVSDICKPKNTALALSNTLERAVTCCNSARRPRGGYFCPCRLSQQTGDLVTNSSYAFVLAPDTLRKCLQFVRLMAVRADYSVSASLSVSILRRKCKLAHTQFVALCAVRQSNWDQFSNDPN
jgi:hypothetical protein